MFKQIADNREMTSVAATFRRRRYGFFRYLLSRLDRPVRVLDIGGTDSFWKVIADVSDAGLIVTLLNIHAEIVSSPAFTGMAGDARSIPFEDMSFDVVFSNSVIEHVGGYEDQKRMADEVRRLGKCYFIQTPNRFFPIEPHFLFPLFQFLPRPIQCLILKNFNLGWFKKTGDLEEAGRIIDGIRLLERREIVSLFPGAGIYEEKFLGMTKSFVAYGGWDARFDATNH